MSNVRPWFRLSSIARPTPQGSREPPPPPPQPGPTSRRPIIVQTPLKQPSPPRQQQAPLPPRQKTPPPPPPPQERSPYHSPVRYVSPPPPPKTESPPTTRSSYTPPPSPKEIQEALPPRKQDSTPSPARSTRSIKYESENTQKATSPKKVLSPYSDQLPSEHKTTQKNILTSEKTSQIHEPNHHNQNHNHQGNNTKKTHHPAPENIMSTRVITIAGKNKGAVMEILRPPTSNKTGRAGKQSSRVLNAGRDNSNFPMKAFMNSNVQTINNSIVYNSTETHHDPGVHLNISWKQDSGNGFHVKDYGNNGGYTK